MGHFWFRALIGVGAMLAVGIGSPVGSMAQDRSRRAAPGAVMALEFVRNHGGQFGFDRDFDTLETERFLSLLSFSTLTDADLATLKSFPAGEIKGRNGASPENLTWPGLLNFQKIILAETAITDRGLAQLHGMEQLEYLDLAGTRVTDAGLAAILPTLPRLRTLILGDQREVPFSRNGRYVTAGTTDRALASVARASTLRNLCLAGLPVTDAGLAPLSSLEGLEKLTLNGTRITDAGLARLKGMKHLRELSLIGTKVTDAGLPHIADLPALRTLNLARTAVSDKGATTLATLPTMRAGERPVGKLLTLPTIILAETKVSDEGLAGLREQLPKAVIIPERAISPEPATRTRQAPQAPGRARTARQRVGGMRSGQRNISEAMPAVPQEKDEEPPFDLKGVWDVTSAKLSRGYRVEFGPDRSFRVEHQFGSSSISPWSYRDGAIRFGGSIRVNEIRVASPWKAQWNGADEIDVTDPNGVELKLKRRASR